MYKRNTSMNDSSLDRAQRDLDTIRSALPTDFPYDRGSIAMSLGAALCSVLFALRAVPGWDGAFSMVLLAAVALAALAACVWLRRARDGRGVRPQRWSFGRQEALAGTVALGALAAYALLTRWSAQSQAEWNFERWRGELAGPGLFAFGVGTLILGVGRWERRSFLGWGAAMTVSALTLPWLDSRAAFWVVGGVAMAIGGVVSSVVLWIQLRHWESMHGRD
jgi:hypothetical protein